MIEVVQFRSRIARRSMEKVQKPDDIEKVAGKQWTRET